MDEAYEDKFPVVYTDDKNRKIISSSDSEIGRKKFLDKLKITNPVAARTAYIPTRDDSREYAEALLEQLLGD